jgi:hypothetical protein
VGAYCVTAKASKWLVGLFPMGKVSEPSILFHMPLSCSRILKSPTLLSLSQDALQGGNLLVVVEI